MDFLLLAQALLMGVVEGLTEFLPISSTGHLILLGELLGFEGPPGKVFEVVIQLGAIGAICWLYRKKLFKTATGLITRNPTAQHFTWILLLGFLPAAVIGFFAHSTIKTLLFSPLTVAISLILGGMVMLWVERKKHIPIIHSVDDISNATALKIGFFQALAMIPGVSRSGATIIGAMLLNVDRKTAAEFSFFLAIPTMLAAATYDLYKNAALLNLEDSSIIAVGFVSAFITALLVVKTAIGFIERYGFAPFAYYRILLGTGTLVWLLLR